jgi:hypothetical protein
MAVTVIRIIATNGAGTTVVQTLGSATKLATEHEKAEAVITLTASAYSRSFPMPYTDPHRYLRFPGAVSTV